MDGDPIVFRCPEHGGCIGGLRDELDRQANPGFGAIALHAFHEAAKKWVQIR